VKLATTWTTLIVHVDRRQQVNEFERLAWQPRPGDLVCDVSFRHTSLGVVVSAVVNDDDGVEQVKVLWSRMPMLFDDDDVNVFRRKLAAALQVPADFLGLTHPYTPLHTLTHPYTR